MAEYGKSITRPSRRSQARSSHFWLKIIGASLTLLIGVLALRSLPKRSSETHPRLESLSSEATHRVSIDANQLVSMLMESDEQFKPKATTLEDGSTQYRYTKRPDEPTPTVQDLQALIDNPKDNSSHQQEIRFLLQSLTDLGVAVVFDHQLDASVGGTWSPGERLIRVNPREIRNGSLSFHETLAHEAIHVAQSCFSGSIGSKPSRIGLIIKYWPSIDNSVNHPIYAENQEEAKLIEREAYSNSKEIGVSASMLNRYCRPNSKRN